MLGKLSRLALRSVVVHCMTIRALNKEYEKRSTAQTKRTPVVPSGLQYSISENPYIH